MHYVKQFHINGVDTKQVACIELHGKPNTATEGAVGVLGMDISSPTHEVYRCVAVNGCVYTWELLSAGMSIMSSTETGEGALTKSFMYISLLIPDGYLIKRGDLILDKEGYLYRVTAIWTDRCDTEYCGTHIGGMASGDKDYSLTIADGKLQLVTESGAIVGVVDAVVVDNETIYRDTNTGRSYVMGVKTVNDKLLRFFVGTQADYDLLTDVQKQDLFAIITDDTALADILEALGEHETRIVNHETRITANRELLSPLVQWCDNVTDGKTNVPKADHATQSDKATQADCLDASNSTILTGTATGTGGARVTLSPNSLYQVVIMTSFDNLSVTLHVGEKNYEYFSSLCSETSDIYRVSYDTSNPDSWVGIVLYKIVNGSKAEYNGSYSVKCIKLADMPSIPGYGTTIVGEL